jgi:hypothetical protein
VRPRHFACRLTVPGLTPSYAPVTEALEAAAYLPASILRRIADHHPDTIA